MANKLYNFSCDVGDGRLVGCADAIGGVQKVYLMTYDEGLLSKFTFSADASKRKIASITANITVHQYDLRPNTASYNANITTSDENGTSFFEQVLEVALAHIEPKDLNYLNNLIQGRCQIFVLDANDNLFLMGAKFGCTVTGGAMSTGTAKADRNGFTLTFTAQEQVNYMTISAGAGTSGFPFDGITDHGTYISIDTGDYPTP